MHQDAYSGRGMDEPRPHLEPLSEIERTALPGLVEVLRTEGIEGVRRTVVEDTLARCGGRALLTVGRCRIGHPRHSATRGGATYARASARSIHFVLR